MRFCIKAFLLSIIFFGCSSGDSDQDQNEYGEQDSIEDQTVEMRYTLTPFSPSPSFQDATLTNMKYENGSFSFDVGGESYELGVQTSDAPQKMCANSGQGQHIHLIVNDSPYAAKYVSTFEHSVEDGDHYILSFLSRSYHESIKSEATSIAKAVTVSAGNITAAEDISDPMIFYSRPKGTYIGKKDTEKVMLDFFLVNANLGTNYQVKATINGEEHRLDTWQPYYIEGLPMGENTIELALVDSNGSLVDTPLNPVSRTFTLQEDPAEQ